MKNQLLLNFLILILTIIAVPLQADELHSTDDSFDGGVIVLMDGSTETKTCAGDGVPDEIMIMLSGAEGPKSAYVVTDEGGKILAIQESNTFDFEGAGAGTCLVWHMGYKDIVGPFQVGMNVSALQGWFDFSNAIKIVREGIAASTISTDGKTEIEICVDDIADPFTVQVSGGVGQYNSFLITDADLNILAKTNSSTFDLNGAGAGTCLIWHVNFNNIFGNVVGLNAGDLGGCFMLSNPITVVRNQAIAAEIALANGSAQTEICAGDGLADAFTPTVTGGSGESSAWVITDSDLNILGLPGGPSFDLEGAGEGTCLLWYVTYDGALSGATVGANAGDLSGCFALSNPITIVRKGVSGGAIEIVDGGTELSICAGDGIADPFSVTVTDAVGETQAWVITDADLNILGLPSGTVFDLEGAGTGTCLLWNLSFNGDITGATVGANAADLAGCFHLSNAITVTRSGVAAASIATNDGETELSICAGDGVADPFTVTVEGGEGENSAWVITDSDLNILGLPAGPTFDLEGAGAGTCLVWYLNYNGEISGATVGANAADLSGCFVLSNPITVSRNGVSGGELALEGGGVMLEICAGDGSTDEFTPSLTGATGANSVWVITDSDLNILGLPPGPTFDLEGAGAGTCLIWNLSFNGEITGAAVGMNAADIEGCFALSNAITVVRNGISAPSIIIEGGVTEIAICAGDGVSDAFTAFIEGGEGESSAWVITDSDLNILGLPEGPTFDLDGAGAGTCLVWYVSFNGELTGVAVGMNAGDLVGCYALSNPITVVRESIGAAAIAIEDGGTELSICAGDGISDAFTAIVEGGEGENSAWVITDSDLNILGLPEGPTFDLEGAGAGTCLVWHVNYNGTLDGAVVGMNAGDLVGCFALSNPITVVRSGVAAAAISIEGGGTELSICAGDGISDAFTAIVEGGVGENSTWVITDADLNILGLPEGPIFDLDGAGAGTCLVWYVTFNGELTGAVVGMNAGDLAGCFELSNPITVERSGVQAAEIALRGGGTELAICAGDGISDEFTPSVSGSTGMSSAWVITDEDLNILGLPEGSSFDLEGAGAGTCLVWHISFNGDLTGAVAGMNAADLGGCFALSNPITVTRIGVAAAAISVDVDGIVTDISICAGDGASDAFTAVVDGGEGDTSGWVITDTLGNVLGLPEGPTFDLEGAGNGVCLIWYFNASGEVSSLMMGANVGDLVGCVVFSNPITVTRSGVSGAALTIGEGATEIDICVGDGVDDLIMPDVEGGMGDKTAWIITDADSIIVGLPFAPPFNLEGAGPGKCLIWQISYNGNIFNIEEGAKAYEIQGCVALSNAITVNRNAVDGGVLALENGGTDLTICAGDGASDSFNVVIDSVVGENTAWVITDEELNILGLPPGGPFDLEGAGAGVCLLWNLSFNGEISGAVVDSNAMNLVGCFALSNPITVTRVTEGALCVTAQLKPEDVDIFPNPAENEINMQMRRVEGDKMNINIFDSFGRVVKTMSSVSSNTENIDISNLAKGVYYLNIVHNGESIVKEFVKL